MLHDAHHIGALLPSERQKPVIHPFCEPTMPGRPMRGIGHCAPSPHLGHALVPGNQLSVEVRAHLAVGPADAHFLVRAAPWRRIAHAVDHEVVVVPNDARRPRGEIGILRRKLQHLRQLPLLEQRPAGRPALRPYGVVRHQLPLDVGIEVLEAREIHARDILDHLPCDVRDGPRVQRLPGALRPLRSLRPGAVEHRPIMPGERLDRAACRSRDLALRAVGHVRHAAERPECPLATGHPALGPHVVSPV